MMNHLFKIVVRIAGFLGLKSYMKINLSYLRKIGLNIEGSPIYIAPTVHFDNIDYSLISIATECVISFDVQLLTHDYSIARAFNALGIDTSKEQYILRGIKIGKNCFIGAKSILCPGVELGDNCIIGAGSVVRGGQYPANSIIAGNPASVVGDTLEWGKKKLESGKYLTNNEITKVF